MKALKAVILVSVLCVAFTGCKKRKAGPDDAAMGYKDVALTEYSLEDFSAPAEELKSIFRTVYFDYNKYNIRESEAPILNDISGWMKDNPGKHLLVEGHCDERGSNEYNLALGEQRSLSIRRYLIDLGVEADRVHTVSYGEERPAMQGSTEEAWSQNRRGEFLLSK